MRKFQNTSVTPPGGFTFICPKTGVRFNHIVFSELKNRVRLFNIANGFPLPPGWEDEFEDRCCENYEPPVWHYVDTGLNTEGRSIQVGDVVNFVRVVETWMEEGREFVAQEDADRRAAICAACPHNQDVAGCTPCVKMIEKVARVLGHRATRFDSQLKGCGVCSCSNQVQVHVPLEVLHRGITPAMVFPEQFCWKAPKHE